MEPRRPRRRAILAALAPTARVAHVGAAATTVAVAAVPAFVTVAHGDSDISIPLILTGVVCGATLGWAADDPAAELLGAVPVSSPMRAAMRVGCVAAVATVGLVLVAVAVELGPGLASDVAQRAPEAGAAASIALAVGFVAARHGERTAGPVGVTAGILGTSTVAGLAIRWPEHLPAFMPSPVHDRWWIIAVIGAAVLACAGRDPGRR